MSLRLAKSPLTDRVYAGRVSKDGKRWIEKHDVTDDFHTAIVEMYGGYQTILSNGKRHFHLSCKEITLKEKKELETLLGKMPDNVRTPIWKLKKRMNELQLELELLKKDPGTSPKEIDRVESELSSLKLEYANRVMELKKARERGK